MVLTWPVNEEMEIVVDPVPPLILLNKTVEEAAGWVKRLPGR